MQEKKSFTQKIKDFFSIKSKGLSFIILISFTVASIILISIMTLFLTRDYELNLRSNIEKNSESVVRQISINIEGIINQAISLSDNVYYLVLKEADINSPELDKDLSLLFEVNSDILDNISIFSKDGDLIKSEPYHELHKYKNISAEKWFQDARSEIENIHFSKPHIQDSFDLGVANSDWVISVSRAVELNENGKVHNGVLVLDIKYDVFIEAMRSLNIADDTTLFLLDQNDSIIYHPKLQEINSNFQDDLEKLKAAEPYLISSKTLGYTGWEVYLLNDYENYSYIRAQTRIYTGLVILVIIGILFIINSIISQKVTQPLQELEADVNNYKDGPEFPRRENTNATSDVKVLRDSIYNMVSEQARLRENIVLEQEAKRRSELEALQAQINPHFLYNTLDSIVWMIENERYEGASEMVSNLANFFRASLANGKSVINLETELKQVRYYLEIQKVRYRDQFEYAIDLQAGLENAMIIKLVVQPIVENAIYYGTSYIDEALIKISAYLNEDKDIYIDVEDNGLGMSPEQVAKLLEPQAERAKEKSNSRGTGMGLANVNERIKLFFGEEYGLEIYSEADEGTLVRIHIPFIDLDHEGGFNG